MYKFFFYESISAKMKNIRLNALHMRGVNELNTKDVFQYFIEYGPSSVEWINDFSCKYILIRLKNCFNLYFFF